MSVFAVNVNSPGYHVCTECGVENHPCLPACVQLCVALQVIYAASYCYLEYTGEAYQVAPLTSKGNVVVGLNSQVSSSTSFHSVARCGMICIVLRSRTT